MSDAMSTLPHCTGCTEPGEHQQETEEHIHDACAATIAALRDALQELIQRSYAESGHPPETICIHCGELKRESHYAYGAPGDNCPMVPAEQALAQPIPPAAAKLLAERDAGRALYTAVRDSDLKYWSVKAAAEAYRKVVD